MRRSGVKWGWNFTFTVSKYRVRKKKNTAKIQKLDLSSLDQKNFLPNQRVIISASWTKNIFSSDDFFRRKTAFCVLRKAEIWTFFPPLLSKSDYFCVFWNQKKQQKFTTSVSVASIPKLFISKQSMIMPLSSNENFVPSLHSSRKKTDFCLEEVGDHG